jgi:hypothetical protein
MEEWEQTVDPLIHTFALATMVLHIGVGQKGQECEVCNMEFR